MVSVTARTLWREESKAGVSAVPVAVVASVGRVSVAVGVGGASSCRLSRDGASGAAEAVGAAIGEGPGWRSEAAPHPITAPAASAARSIGILEEGGMRGHLAEPGLKINAFQ